MNTEDRRGWAARMGMRDDWLDGVREGVVDPEREIVDPHHHLWRRGGAVYELDALRRDTGDGHRVTKTMFIECFESYRPDGPEHLRPVGETEYAARLAEASEADPAQATIAGIVAHADLRLPLDMLDEALDAQAAAAGGRLRGIRHSGSHDPEPAALCMPGRAPAGLYENPDFRRGLRRLGERGLTFDAWHYHHQNAAFRDLAASAPDTTMVLDHFGTPIGVGRFAGKRTEVFEAWKDDVAAIAALPNTVAKLGGFAMIDNGWGWHERERPPSSDEFIEAQGPWFRHMIACFGSDRCMFESNFPVDRASIGYRTLWNAFKKLAAEHDAAAQEALLSGTATRVYRL